MMCGDGKESIRPVSTMRPVIQEIPVEHTDEKPVDPLKQAIREALGVHRS